MLEGSSYDFRTGELSIVAGSEPEERLSRLEEVAAALVKSGTGMLPGHERPLDSKGNGE
jgi:hypothetical protein